jgi:hypothetical protein
MTVATAPARKLDARTAEVTLSIELDARRQEAGLFASAIRTVIRQLEAVLLSPVSEVPIEAFALTAQLRSMGDRYERRWEDQS